MNTIDHVDPELRGALDGRPLLRLNAKVLERSRQFVVKTAEAAEAPDTEDVLIENLYIPSAFGDKPIRVLAYRPSKATKPLPAIVHVHGGGFVLGLPEMKDTENRQLVSKLRCAVFSVDYRLAPEARYPSQLHDIYSVLLWAEANAASLGVNPACIGLKGESGGGGLAAATALFARDQAGPALSFQHLTYPMIDDRTAVRSDLNPFVGEFVWTQEHNKFGWESLLGYTPGTDDVSPYAAVSRALNLSGLPPTFIAVGGLDLFLDENIAYASALSRAGVSVEFHIYPGAYHGFQIAAQSRIARQAEQDSHNALRRLMGI